VIQTELTHRFGLSAILTSITIASKQSLSIESDRRFGQSIEQDQSDDARHLQLSSRGSQIILAIWFLKRLELGKLAPALEIVVAVLVILDRDNLSTTSIEKSHRSPNVDDANRHVESVQNQNATI
jgi:hypothetical protein